MKTQKKLLMKLEMASDGQADVNPPAVAFISFCLRAPALFLGPAALNLSHLGLPE